MKQLLRKILLVPFLVGVAMAADTPPPIPVVPKDTKTVVGFERPKPNPGVWTRIEKFNEQAKAGGFDVLFIGDSITHCWDSEHGKAVWEKKIAPFNAVNFGIGGDTTESVIWRLDNGNLTGALNPKIVVLMIGTNNSAAGDKPEAIAAGVGAILERLHKRFPLAKLLLYGIFPRHEPNLRQNNDAVNKILATYDGHWNIKYVDIKPVMAKPDGAPLDGTTYDGLHPVEKGYDIWADSLVAEFKAILTAPAWPGKQVHVYELPARTEVPTTKDPKQFSFTAATGKEYGLTTSVLTRTPAP